jgi:hypothetical protein
MFRASRFIVGFALLALLVVPGCTALKQLAALRTVTFAFSHVSDVRVAGIRMDERTSFSSLGAGDVARLAAAVLAKEVPLEMVAHVNATNPAENTVAASLVDLGWKLFIEDRQTLTGGLGSPVSIAPGQTADVPLMVRLDLVQLGNGGAKDLYDLAVAIAGHGKIKKDLRLELAPTIKTALGAIRYPVPVVVRRAATGS